MLMLGLGFLAGLPATIIVATVFALTLFEAMSPP
jgi:hypothetical protein